MYSPETREKMISRIEAGMGSLTSVPYNQVSDEDLKKLYEYITLAEMWYDELQRMRRKYNTHSS